MNGEEAGDGSLKSFYGYKETFGKETTWVSIPKTLTFIHTSNPYEDEDGEAIGSSSIFTPADFDTTRRETDFDLDHAAYPAYATHGLEALSAAATQDQYNYAPIPSTTLSQHESTTGSLIQAALSSPSVQNTPSQNLDFILNTSTHLPPGENNIDPRLHPNLSSDASPVSHSHVRTYSFTPAANGRLPPSKGPPSAWPSSREPELSFLLRDFSERAGLWMDIFDLNLFFAAQVPILAVRCPLLLYSCASLSCKSLARVDGRKPIVGGQGSPSGQSTIGHWPGPAPDAEGWMRKGREFYDLAVSLLRQALAGASRPPTSALPEDTSPTAKSIALGVPLPRTDSDELLAATAILCVYEFLDGSGLEWSSHLDGAKTLFDIAKDSIGPLAMSPTPDMPNYVPSRHISEEPSQGRRAVFWNFARQDMLSAFIHNDSTRLDTADLPMWRSAGLKLTVDGSTCPSNPDHADYVAEDTMTDDMISNALVWLTMKLVNFISAADDSCETFLSLDGSRQRRSMLEHWERLDAELRIWYEGLPDGFHAAAVSLRNPEYGMEEKWFPRPMCASTMQWYHFARIQLLYNKPHVSTASLVRGPAAPGTSLALRQASYATIMYQTRKHAKEIVAISLGRSNEGARIHAVQPLWTAGQVLGSEANPTDEVPVSSETQIWRRTIVEQLRGIAQDMGWETSYRIQSLLELWGLPTDWPGRDGDG